MTKNLTLSDRLQEAWRKVLRKFEWFLVRLATTGRVLTVGVSLCLYGFTIDHPLKEATLVYILHLHKKTRFLKSHYTGFEYFR